MSAIRQRIEDLGLRIPSPPAPVAAYVPAVRAGGLLYVSGQLPLLDGELVAKGPVASVVDVVAARAAARQCALNGLAVVAGAVDGDLDRVVRIVRLGVFVASDPDFTGQPAVADGASDLLQEIFGETGRHARAAVGAAALPLGATVEVEMVVEAA